MSEMAGDILPEQKLDWRDKQLRKKHAKLQAAKRENDELRRILNENGISIPSLEGAV